MRWLGWRLGYGKSLDRGVRGRRAETAEILRGWRGWDGGWGEEVTLNADYALQVHEDRQKKRRFFYLGLSARERADNPQKIR